MIQIYLCEDDPIQLRTLSSYVEKYLPFHDFNQRLACATTDPYVLLKELKQSKEVGLYFLDIDLQTDIDGLELARRIRAYDPRGYVVFITTHGEGAPLTFLYQVEALDFIKKDEPDKLSERIWQCMKAAAMRELAVQKQNNNLITLKVDKTIITLNQSDILFIQSDPAPHMLVIHMSNGMTRMTASFKELASILDSRFFRCHKSILVNLDHAVSYHSEKRELLMDNGEVCPVAIRVQSVLREKLET